MKTGNTRRPAPLLSRPRHASMEPGHEDREYPLRNSLTQPVIRLPQWSPVMKTGNTWEAYANPSGTRPPQWSPVMKTGNTSPPHLCYDGGHDASMEPGHEDREYPAVSAAAPQSRACLNGARS